MSPAAKVFIGIIIVSIAAIAGMFMVPLPATWQGTATDFYLSLAGSTITAVLHIGSAWFFVMSLGAYKAKLRVAYGIIAFSLVLTALGTLQLPLLDAFGQMNSFWALSGLVTLPFLIAGLGIYIGARGFARLVGVKSVLAKIRFVLPTVIVLIFLTSLLPHPPVDRTEIVYDASNGLLIWTCLLFLAAALVILKARRQLGAHYIHAATWLLVGLSGSAAIIGSVLFGIFILGDGNRLAALTDILTVMAAAVYLKAGYAFYKTKEF